MRELLLGCGSRTKKDLCVNNRKEFEDVVRLDNNPSHKPDVLWDLKKHPLPFKNNEFDEIHCYEVLEHLAIQGDYKFFFREFSEYWRILKPCGMFFATVPSRESPWAFGDPSHTRIIVKENLNFLSQDEYSTQVGKTNMSDFRSIYKADFKVAFIKETEHKLMFGLEVIK